MSAAYPSPQRAQSDNFGSQYKRSFINLDRDSILARILYMTAAILPVSYVRSIWEGEMGAGEAALMLLVTYLFLFAVYGLLNLYWMRKN